MLPLLLEVQIILISKYVCLKCSHALLHAHGIADDAPYVDKAPCLHVT
jgi:hypothetical protein